MRGPTIRAPAAAAKPPTMWTAPDPAKSIAPVPASRGPVVRAILAHPAGDQMEWTTTGYTQAAMKKE